MHLLLYTAGMAIGTGEIGIRRIDVDKVMALRIDLIERFAAALREDEMT